MELGAFIGSVGTASRQDDCCVDHVRGLSLATQHASGFCERLVESHDFAHATSRKRSQRDLRGGLTPNLSQHPRRNDDSSASIESLAH